MEECLFCKIVKGEIPSQKVYEDDKVLAFKDINPAAKIHVLVIPKKHIENIMNIKEEDSKLLSDIFKSIKEVAKIVGLEKDGFRLISNCGRDSGQEVMHLHFHILGGEKLGPKII